MLQCTVLNPKHKFKNLTHWDLADGFAIIKETFQNANKVAKDPPQSQASTASDMDLFMDVTVDCEAEEDEVTVYEGMGYGPQVEPLAWWANHAPRLPTLALWATNALTTNSSSASVEIRDTFAIRLRCS